MNIRIGSTVGVLLQGSVTRCNVIGEISTVSNKVLVQRECDSKIFAISIGLVTWVNGG